MKKKGPKFGPDGYEDDDPSDPDFPSGKLTRIPDFLPPPEELVFKAEPVKVTMVLSKASVAFFKKKAREHHVPYQTMIRSLVDAYVARHV